MIWNHSRPLYVGLALVPCLFLASCTTFGPKRVPTDRFNYNSAIARSTNQQMLLNLVRLRYRDVPVFLAVSSVLTQYIYSGNAAVTGSIGQSLGNEFDSITGTAGLLYVERPTITYSPLTGEEFAQQLLTPISAEEIFSLVQSGWPPAQILIMSLERLNKLRNLPFYSEPSPEDLEQVRTFQRVVRLIVELGKRTAIEMQREDNEERSGKSYLVFEDSRDTETLALIGKLKRALDLDPNRSKFRITSRLTRRKPEEITVRVRSLLALMGFLSGGVEIPAVHVEKKRVREVAYPADAKFIYSLFPLRIRSIVDRPTDAFVAAQYQNHWFYIPHSDHASKQAFGLLTYIFQLKSPQAPTAGPLLTVPTG